MGRAHLVHTRMHPLLAAPRTVRTERLQIRLATALAVAQSQSRSRATASLVPAANAPFTALTGAQPAARPATSVSAARAVLHLRSRAVQGAVLLTMVNSVAPQTSIRVWEVTMRMLSTHAFPSDNHVLHLGFSVPANQSVHPGRSAATVDTATAIPQCGRLAAPLLRTARQAVHRSRSRCVIPTYTRQSV